MSSLEIVLLIIASIILLLLLAALFWWLRRRIDGSARSCYLAVQQMERDLGLKDRYQSPWLMLLGDEQQTSDLCRAWRLSSSGKPGWFGRWWYDSDAAVLAVPGAMFNHGEGAMLQIAAWWRMLRTLLMMRAGRPLDAVIWTLPAEQLWSAEQATMTGLLARRKLNEMLQRLGLSVPVYILVTGMETVPGIRELAEVLPEDARDRVFGWSSPFAPSTPWHPEWSEIALDQLVRSLSEEITELGVLSGRIEDALYLLPRQFEAIRSNLQALCDPVFHASAPGETPQLRGIYFCASLPINGVDTDPLTEVQELPREPLFVRRLLRHRVLAEQGLAKPVPRILHLRRRWQRIAGASTAALGLLWLVGILWLWQVESEQADNMAALLHELKTNNVDGLVSNAGARQNITIVWTLLNEAPRWRFASLLLPSSLFSTLDQQLQQQLLYSVSHKLYKPLHATLQRNIAEVSTADLTASRRRTGDSASPEQWPEYVRAEELLKQIQALEQNSAQYNQMLDGSKSPLDDATTLAKATLNLELNAQTLPLHARYNRLLARTPQALASPIDLSSIHQKTGKHFVLLMRLWLDRLFADENFSSTAGQVKRQLQHLQQGQRNSILDLEELSLSITKLRRLITTTNVAWSRSSGQELAPGYGAMLEAAGKSSLIGPVMVDEVLDHASQLQKVFREQWLDDSEPKNSILRQLSGGSIDFQPSLSKLEVSIEMLLNQDFAAAALTGDGQDHFAAELRGIDADSLNASLRYFASYRSYLEQGIAKVPYEYRSALNSSAKSSTAATLWKLLSTLRPNSSSLDDSRAFNLPAQEASEVVTAFLALGRQDMAEKLLQELNYRALLDLNNADTALQNMALYQPLHGNFNWWSGDKNAGLRAYRSSNTLDMQQYLASQLDQVGDLHSTIVPALDWLQANKKSLSVTHLALLQRWQDLTVELQKYSEKSPSSAPALFERFANSLNTMELTNCNTALAEVELPTGSDAFSSRARDVADLVSQRCAYLQEETASTSWNHISLYFSQYLAGRFPFTLELQGADADPDRVRLFLQLLDANLAQAQTGLTNHPSTEASAAMEFLNQLQQARAWLDPLFQRNKDGIKGIDLDVRWRTDREAELGADQIIEWSLASGNQQIHHPADNKNRLRWTLGQSVKLTLRWAKNAAQKPADDPKQVALAVFDYEAGWEYNGAWALLRMLRSHVSFERIPTIDYSETPLAFQLPVYAPYSVDNHALMFIRIALMNPSGKTPLVLAPLPIKAPGNPFFSPTAPNSQLPDSFSSARPDTF